MISLAGCVITQILSMFAHTTWLVRQSTEQSKKVIFVTLDNFQESCTNIEKVGLKIQKGREFFGIQVLKQRTILGGIINFTKVYFYTLIFQNSLGKDMYFLKI